MSFIAIGIPTYNRYDKLIKCLKSVNQSSLVARVTIIDNGGKLSPEPDFSVHTPGKNMGVAASWNWLIQNISEPLLICNDDIEFGENDIRAFYDAYQTSEAGLFYTDNVDFLNMFSCFMVRPVTIEKIGYFDEAFYPAYFEDCDYFRRMVLAEISWQSVPTNIIHAASSTLKGYNSTQMIKHHADFNKNQDYYKEKWGGMPTFETFNSPWNR